MPAGGEDYYKPVRSCRTDTHLLIRHFPSGPGPDGQGNVELFDLREDPHTLRDIAGMPGQTETVAALDERLKHWMEISDEPLRHGPIPDPLAP